MRQQNIQCVHRSLRGRLRGNFKGINTSQAQQRAGLFARCTVLHHKNNPYSQHMLIQLMYWCECAPFWQKLTSLFTFICLCTHNPCTYYHVLLLEELGVIETHFPRRLRTFAGVSNCSREGRLRKLNLQIWFLEGSETNSITEDTKNYIFMFINSVAEGKKLRLYFWRR